jgi:hypothetical protein
MNRYIALDRRDKRIPRCIAGACWTPPSNRPECTDVDTARSFGLRISSMASPADDATMSTGVSRTMQTLTGAVSGTRPGCGIQILANVEFFASRQQFIAALQAFKFGTDLQSGAYELEFSQFQQDRPTPMADSAFDDLLHAEYNRTVRGYYLEQMAIWPWPIDWDHERQMDSIMAAITTTTMGCTEWLGQADRGLVLLKVIPPFGEIEAKAVGEFVPPSEYGTLPMIAEAC